MTKSEEVRIGVTVPSVNSVVEAWYPRAVPEHVSVHFARMLMPSDATPERIIEMDRTDGVRSIRQLASCRPHAIAAPHRASCKGANLTRICASRSARSPAAPAPAPPRASSPPAPRSGCSE